MAEIVLLGRHATATRFGCGGGARSARIDAGIIVGRFCGISHDIDFEQPLAFFPPLSAFALFPSLHALRVFSWRKHGKLILVKTLTTAIVHIGSREFGRVLLMMIMMGTVLTDDEIKLDA